jgi:serine/threonine protein kinase
MCARSIEDNHLYILTELCEFGSLERIAKAHKPCCEHYLLCLLWDMARALVHLHQRRMVHLDIKPENIFSVSPLDPYAHSAGSLRVLAVLQPLDALDKMTCDESMPPSVRAHSVAVCADFPMENLPSYNRFLHAAGPIQAAERRRFGPDGAAVQAGRLWASDIR